MVLGGSMLDGREARRCCALSVEGRMKLKVGEATKSVGLSSYKARSVLRVENVRVSGSNNGLSVTVCCDRLCEC